MNQAELRQKLLAAFAVEAEEHIEAIAKGLAVLEHPGDEGTARVVLEQIFREAHSLKGAARIVEKFELGDLCQALESIFSTLKSSGAAPSGKLLESLYDTVDALRECCSPECDSERIAELVRRLQELAAAEDGGKNVAAPITEVPPPMEPLDSRQAGPSSRKPVVGSTIRISVNKLDSLFAKTEELVSQKLRSEQHLRHLTSLREHIVRWQRESGRLSDSSRAVRTAMERSENGNAAALQEPLHALEEFIDWSNTFHKELEQEMTQTMRRAHSDQRALALAVDDLRDEAKGALLLPFAPLLDVFPRFVRDTARELGKDVELKIEGREVEVDRRVLEEIKDPLMHLVRNCIDHGIEPIEERKQSGKRAAGTLSISVSPAEGNMIRVSVGDDGAGINPEAVKRSYLASTGASAESIQPIEDEQILSLIFRSGVSTSPAVTNLSGRGLGLAIVEDTVKKLGGSVNVSSELGRGTIFQLTVPLTISSFRGILVKVGGHSFVFPMTSVKAVLRAPRREVKTVQGKETIVHQEQVISLIPLGSLLGIAESAHNGGAVLALVLEGASYQVALAVDEITNELEVVLKPLVRPVAQVKFVEAVTIVGDGRIVPILSRRELLEAAAAGRLALPHSTVATRTAPPPSRAILVAEDSVTARTLLKNILESAGYRVTTAVDGLDAFAALRNGGFDLLVSDVEMPRMGGFELTSKVRADKELGQLPVVLVTARDAPEDIERGIEVGANAYVVKGSFNQINLLEVIKKLV